MFCQSYDETMALFQSTVLELHKCNCLYVYNKQGNSGHICDKFDGCTAENTKAKIVANFTNPDGFIRILIATVAFGMELDSPNIRRIIIGGWPQILNFMCKKQVELVVTNRKHMQYFISKAKSYLVMCKIV